MRDLRALVPILRVLADFLPLPRRRESPVDLSGLREGTPMKWVLKRLQEPSTWRGIVWIATAMGVTLNPMAWEYVMAIGMAVAGLLGVLLSDAPVPAPSPAPSPSHAPPQGLPPIELQGRATAHAPAATPAAPAAGELRDGVPTVPNFGVRPPVERPLDDQFSGGWGDR